MAAPPAPPPPAAPPAPLPPIPTLIAALNPQQRAALRALLPSGWRPGEPLPPHLPDLRTLLQRVQGT
jgi:hypothetical protein